MFARTKNLKLSTIKQIELLASGYPDVISLAQGIPSFDTPGCIKRRVENALKRGVVSKYSLSPGLPELRELIEISLAKENMFYDWQNEIIVTTGSIEAITATLMTVTEPGDEVILPDPAYASYKEVVTLAGCTPVFVPLDEENNWSLNLKRIESSISTKTKAILYSNPNNPTGTIYSKEQLQSLEKLADVHNLYLVSDEVYKDFIYDDSKYYSVAENKKLRSKIIRVFSFSKAYAMTGWRIGFLHSDESLVREILKVHDALVTCAPVISQFAAMGALEMGDSDITAFKNEFLRRRDLVCKCLDKLSDYLTYAKPMGAYFIFPRLEDVYIKQKLGWSEGESASWSLAMDMLEKINVAVVPGIAFGPNGENHFRINFGRSENDINNSFERMEKYFISKSQ